ncbi:TonB-dependent siderophore receptor [Robbsia sp. Bb-Pol-6]|uniref:TonB-dependent siderophore receptor n=1 Tax=Robbsia betulipollinis TaxID=2981849 RepID=A0ABT3ZJD6_9BURK|nr:TonB-dependent siderophore receptor [Robbsia betulipollinis]MCY0386103.1 TonB-dependent siderophore receptor [Robbsia betulipollinis]
MDDEQNLSLADALYNVPGVVANTYGRRGWDDFIIRGETASNAIFLDGLRTAANSRVAEQLFDMEQVEVLKGPASLLSGFVLPGGVVNMVSKRPLDYTFANVDTTVGSHALYQASVDMGTPLSANGKAAFRVSALAMNAHDETDYVWSKSRSIAPSLSLDFGPRTDFTILTSYQERTYIRQQGLPLKGSVLPNANGAISRSTFTGEPGEQPYDGNEARVGYAFTHRFDSGWTVNQNFRWQRYTMGGVLVANGTLAANGRTLSRTATDQTWSGNSESIDTNVQKTFHTAFGDHQFIAGTDYSRDNEELTQYTCTVGTLNVYAPVYGSAIKCGSTPKTRTSTTIRDLGFYLRDQIALGPKWRILAGLRYDRADTDSLDQLGGAYSTVPASAVTGSAAVMYELWTGVRPYVSYASSFYPNAGTDIDGQPFKAEKGRQWEAGVKFGQDTSASTVTLAVFDLRRKNVLETNPVDDDYSIAVGEERSRGVELGFTSDLTRQLSVTGGYAYTNAVILDDGGQSPSTNGERLDNVPRHSFTLYTRYRFPGSWHRWEVNGGIRGQNSAYAYGYMIPGYAVSNLGVAYHANRWHAALRVGNVFNRHYYTGGLKAAVALGDDRSVMLTAGFQY